MEKTTVDLNELENVTGGFRKTARRTKASVQRMPVECPRCHHVFSADVAKSSISCPQCSYIIEIKG